MANYLRHNFQKARPTKSDNPLIETHLNNTFSWESMLCKFLGFKQGGVGIIELSLSRRSGYGRGCVGPFHAPIIAFSSWTDFVKRIPHKNVQIFAPYVLKCAKFWYFYWDAFCRHFGVAKQSRVLILLMSSFCLSAAS